MAYEEIRTGVVSVQHGGTGATDAATARANLGVVPTTRTINGKPLSSDITLTASDLDISSGGSSIKIVRWS